MTDRQTYYLDAHGGRIVHEESNVFEQGRLHLFAAHGGAINEGGRHGTSGLTVQGVGGANRHHVETAFFRAMTDLMPSSPHMGQAALAILQSAADLFGPDSATH